MPVLSPGDMFGGYRIEGIAGRGGMGVVYRAVQLDLGRPVALKLIAADRAADPDFRERFQRESRMAAAIDHPNVVPIHGAGEVDGQLYLAMRFVQGTDLHRLIKREGPLAPDRAASIVAQVGAALDAAHAAGLVHRDVKPANVLLAGEHAYLSDFGLTRLLASDTQLTEPGQWIGTIDFSSPEQLQGRRVDARADVYSLGCVLHAALLGAPPYPRGTVPATMLAHLQDPLPRPSDAGRPAGFDRVMARALAKSQDDRYPSAGDLGRAAEAAARGEAVTESERSVAAGPAAPVPPARNGHSAPQTAVTVADLGGEDGLLRPHTAATRVDRPVRTERAPLDPLPPAPARRQHTGTALVVVLGLAAAAGAIVVSGLRGADGSDARKATAPLSEGDVRDVADAFARAYEQEDGAGLRRIITRDVQRVLPGGVARGRARIVEEYQRQFRANATQSYELEDLEIQGGRAGRASGTYRVKRDDGDAIEGRIVLGVVRDRGEPRIGLIAVTPSS